MITSIASVPAIAWMSILSFVVLSLFATIVYLCIKLKKKTYTVVDEGKKNERVMEISSPTNLEVKMSCTKNLANMLPPHIFVPMASEIHEELYDRFRAREAASTSESRIERVLVEGMDEENEAPIAAIDDI